MIWNTVISLIHHIATVIIFFMAVGGTYLKHTIL